MHEHQIRLPKAKVDELKAMHEAIDRKFVNRYSGGTPDHLWGFVGQEGIAQLLGARSTAKVCDTLLEAARSSGYDVKNHEVKSIPPGRVRCAIERRALDHYPGDKVIIIAKITAEPDGGATVAFVGCTRAVVLKSYPNDPRLTAQPGILVDPDDGNLYPWESLLQWTSGEHGHAKF